MLRNLNKASGNDYQILGSYWMPGGLQTLLVSKKAVHSQISNIVTSQCVKAEGRSLALRFKIEDTSFCFFNCQIVSTAGYSLLSQKPIKTLSELYSESFKQTQERGAVNGKTYDINAHDIKVLAGDMGFRLQLPDSEDFNKVCAQIADGQFERLLRKDEFN